MEATEEILDADFLAACGDIPDTLGAAPTASGNVSGPPAAQSEITSMELTVDRLEWAIHEASKLPGKYSGPERAFWEISPLESRILAETYLPYLKPLWDRVSADARGKMLLLIGPTAMVLGPRLLQELSLHRERSKNRASMTAASATETSTASPSSVAPPAAENPSRQTDWSSQPIDA